jgi:hypothetical protein
MREVGRRTPSGDRILQYAKITGVILFTNETNRNTCYFTLLGVGGRDLKKLYHKLMDLSIVKLHKIILSLLVKIFLDIPVRAWYSIIRKRKERETK